MMYKGNTRTSIMGKVTLELEVPSELLAMLGRTRSSAAETVTTFSILGLYMERSISSGKTAELMGLQKADFIRLLAKKGIPYFDYQDEELDEEFRAVDTQTT